MSATSATRKLATKLLLQSINKPNKAAAKNIAKWKEQGWLTEMANDTHGPDYHLLGTFYIRGRLTIFTKVHLTVSVFGTKGRHAVIKFAEKDIEKFGWNHIGNDGDLILQITLKKQ